MDLSVSDTSTIALAPIKVLSNNSNNSIFNKHNNKFHDKTNGEPPPVPKMLPPKRPANPSTGVKKPGASPKKNKHPSAYKKHVPDPFRSPSTLGPSELSP